jgi:hypothetical protein
MTDEQFEQLKEGQRDIYKLVGWILIVVAGIAGVLIREFGLW